MNLICKRQEDPDTVSYISTHDCSIILDLISLIRINPQLGIPKDSGIITLSLTDGTRLLPEGSVSELLDMMSIKKDLNNTILVTVRSDLSILNARMYASSPDDLENAESPNTKRVKVDDGDVQMYKNFHKLLDLLFSTGFQDISYSLLASPSKYVALHKLSITDWYKKVHDKKLSESLYNMLHETTFSGENYQVRFPFFPPNGESYMTLFERDDVLQSINEIASSESRLQKYTPIIISTTRGMGKTFLLKMLALQRVEDRFKCARIENAKNCGRIISFDFSELPEALKGSEVKQFIKKLLIFYLCFIFDGTFVDGILFEKIDFGNLNKICDISNIVLKQHISGWWAMDIDTMMDEYIRLTNIAFNTSCDIPPVFLFDEIQEILDSTTKKSMDGHYYTVFSTLLASLSRKYQPLCICSGINHGDVDLVREATIFIPRILSLTPLVSSSDLFWKILLEEKNLNSKTPEVSFDDDKDKDLVDSLIYASYQVPRLLYIAFEVWYAFKHSDVTNLELPLQEFERRAAEYYEEMAEVLKKYSVSDISHIILSCAVHFPVEKDTDSVPGTHISWRSLIQKSLIFPYLDDCYIFPFALIWKKKKSPSGRVQSTHAATQNRIVEFCSSLIPGLDLTKLFLTYDKLCKYNMKDLGLALEYLFAASLATKYYLITKCRNPMETPDLIKFSDIYDFGEKVSDSVLTLLGDLEIDFSQGIFRPAKEAFVDTPELPAAVIHNVLSPSAHHDILLPTNLGRIPVSVKGSFTIPAVGYLDRQYRVSKQNLSPCRALLVVYLGSAEKSNVTFDFIDQNKLVKDAVVFIDGSGVCNGLALDMYKLLKYIKSTPSI
jgi:hypothetical protein